jgi:hypothetical protein
MMTNANEMTYYTIASLMYVILVDEEVAEMDAEVAAMDAEVAAMDADLAIETLIEIEIAGMDPAALYDAEVNAGEGVK